MLMVPSLPFHGCCCECRDWYGGPGDFPTRCAGAQQVVQAFTAFVTPVVTAQLASASAAGPCALGARGSLGIALATAAAAGRFPRKHLIPNLFFLVAAGQETTAALIASSLLAVCVNPADRAAALRPHGEHLHCKDLVCAFLLYSLSCAP